MKALDPQLSTLLSKIEELEALVRQQASRIAELEKRLGKNSRNSSKPPSSDGLGKPPRTSSLRENGNNKSGGQKGHKGETLKQVEHPDKTVRLALEYCPDCGLSLSEQRVEDVVKRQVFDIPTPTIEVTEHQTESRYCSCCNKVVSSLFPDTVSSPAQYGSVIRSWAAY